MRFLRSRTARGCGTLALLLLLPMCFALAGLTASPARADTGQDPSWGAIAAIDGWHGYAFNQRSRGAAEAAARAQCDRAAGRAGACIVRAYFDRSCGALARGNFGEWATATAPTAAAAGKAATAQCDGHLPTEPCRVVVSVCSGGVSGRGESQGLDHSQLRLSRQH